MNIASFIILTILTVAVLFAIRAMRHGHGDCCGKGSSCSSSQCGKGCNGCCR